MIGDDDINDAAHAVDQIVVEVVLEEVLDREREVLLQVDRVLGRQVLHFTGNEEKAQDDRFFVEHVVIGVVYLEVHDIVDKGNQIGGRGVIKTRERLCSCLRWLHQGLVYDLSSIKRDNFQEDR